MKKQLLRLTLSALLFCCVLVCVPHASAASGVLVLPANTQRVETEAFMNDSSLSLVVIPEGTTYIGERAFAFSSVTEVTLSDTLTFIDDTAFAETPLQKVSASKGTYAYDWAVRMGYIRPETDPALFTYSVSNDTAAVTGFADRSNYPESIVIPQANPDGLPVIGIASAAFKGSANLREAVLQENIVSVAANAFQNCPVLEKIVLSEGLETIGGSVNNVNGAFAGCVKLTEVTIPSTVTTIANRAFYGCELLSSLTIRGSDDCRISIGECAFEGTALAGTLTIPAKVNAIGPNAFKGTKLTELVIEEGEHLETIGSGAFRACKNLDTVTIPANVKTISANAFQDCILLRTLNLSEGLEVIGGSVNNVNGAFAGCVKLTEVTIPSTVTTIANRAFYGCELLSSLTILGSSDCRISIGECAFEGTVVAGPMTLPAKVNAIGPNAFKGTKITELVIEEGEYLETIGSGAFRSCDVLAAVTIPANVKTISANAFQDCILLRTLNLSEGLEVIGGSVNNVNGAFAGCVKLTEVTIPSTVTTIANRAFYGCELLSSLTILDSADCKISIGECAFEGTVLAGTLTIPVKVNAIGPNAFKGTKITELVIEEGNYLETIGSGAFRECKNLDTVTIPANVKTISANAFQDCILLRTLNLSEGLEVIGGSVNNVNGAFAGCVKLTEVTIPSTVTTIANRAFFGCTLLSSLTILDSQDYEISIGESAFEGTALAGTLTIPAKVRAIGAGAFEGIRITSLVIEEGNYLETIGDSAFRECVSLETVTIPGNVKSINANAFRNCITLRTLNLSEGLQAIKGTVNNVNGAFAGCIALESVTIPGTVTSIGNRAFYGCTGLSDIRIKAPEGTVSIGTEAFKNCPGAPYYI